MRIQNTFPEKKTIAQILKYIKSARTPVMGHNQYQSIKNILKDNSQPKHLFQIIGLYHYMAISEDKKAFLSIDSLLFPSRGFSQSAKIKNVTLKLAYLRLHCLLKYQQPYSNWIQVTRQLLHHSKLSSTDIRSMLALAFFSFIKLDSQLLQLYSEFLSYFDEEFDKIDTISLMVLRKFFSKEKIRTTKSSELKQKIEKILTQQTQNLTLRQCQLLMTCNVLHKNWFFMYIFKTNLVGLKKFGFFIDILHRPYSWRSWALSHYGRQGVLQRIPNFGKVHPSMILQNIQLKIAIGRPFCDEFFEIQVIEDSVSGMRRYRLKNYQSIMHLYIQNAYILLTNGGVVIEDQFLTKIEEILEDVINSKFPGRPEIYLYLALHSSITYLKYSKNKFLKAEKQKKVIQNVHFIMNNKELIDVELLQYQHNYKSGRYEKKIVITRILRPLAILQLDSYKLPEFISIYKLLLICPQDLQKAMKFSSMSGEITEIKNVIANYMLNKKSNQPLILFGQFKKHPIPMVISGSNSQKSELEFYSATNIQFDRTITVDFLLKIKNINTGKQIKIMLDLGVTQDWPPCEYKSVPTQEYLQNKNNVQEIITVRKYWKKKYISEWYGEIFQVHPQQTIEQYIQSRKYEKFL